MSTIFTRTNSPPIVSTTKTNQEKMEEECEVLKHNTRLPSTSTITNLPTKEDSTTTSLEKSANMPFVPSNNYPNPSNEHLYYQYLISHPFPQFPHFLYRQPFPYPYFNSNIRYEPP